MYGDVVLANPFSQIGNIGFRMTPWMLKAFMRDSVRVQIKVATKGDNKHRLNRFEEHKPEDIEWAQALIGKMKDGLV